ncbi:FixH family protein [Polyangium aurulentum]|uniref:FixH family protein n=1 Tax=Polyangium aurulentum TaxID=2567896 RepID=UPI0010AE1C19|nr:FixH family protein [Polyangium aurulentum]UQA62248.1 FixH family protein [Polyangium aurulentum]
MIERTALHGSIRQRAVIFALVAPLLAACGADAGDGAGTMSTTLGVKESILFVVEADRTPAAGANQFRLVLQDASTSEPIPGAAVDVHAVMRSMGHDSATSSIEEIGEGAYSVESLFFSMPGLWEVRYRATHEATTDEAAFMYEIP